MASQQQPEIGVRITASTSGLSQGFQDAIRTTEQGVQRLQLVQSQTSRGIAAVGQAADDSAKKMAQAAAKGLQFSDALARGGASASGVASKFIGVASVIGTSFGPGSVVALAIAGFASMFIGEMNRVEDELDDLEAKWKATITELVNAGDVAKLTKMAQDIWLGTPAEKFKDGIVAAQKEVDRLKALQQGNVFERLGQVFNTAPLEEAEARLKALQERFQEVRGWITDVQNVPFSMSGLLPIVTQADAPGKKTPPNRAAIQAARDEARERDALAEANYAREQALAGEDYQKKLALAQAHLEEISAVYGTQSSEYVRALTAMEQADKEAKEKEKQRQDDVWATWHAGMDAIREIQREVITDYQNRWEAALQRVQQTATRAFSGIFSGTKSLGDAFRDLGRIILQSIAESITKSLIVFIAAEITKRAMGEATAKQTVVNSAVEAASRAYAAMAGIPFVGPAVGALAAAGTFAAVLAFGSSIASAAGGWAQVPSDQMAMVHKNEMVLPAPLAESIRQMASSAGGTGAAGGGTINVTAMDARSFRAFLGANGEGLADAIMELIRNGQLALRT